MELPSLLGPSPPELTRQGGAGGWRVASGSSSGAQRSTIVAVRRLEFSSNRQTLTLFKQQ
jgi:hypothetical protein